MSAVIRSSDCRICQLLKNSGEDDVCFEHGKHVGILYRVIPEQVIFYGDSK